DGRGILTITGEDLGDPSVYGRDRVFVALDLPGVDPSVDARLVKLEGAGHPVVRIPIPDATELGAEFFRWEFATAVAAAVMAVDPFDQPDVQESKDTTKRLLDEVRQSGKMPKAEAATPDKLSAFLQQAREFDCVALLAYVDRRGETERALHEVRMAIRD